LAGLAVAAVCHPREVVLTDGNKTSSENLEKICDENIDSVISRFLSVTKHGMITVNVSF
jgi:hypothetical protein